MTFHPAQALWFLISTALTFCALLALLRAAADAARLSYAQPLMQLLLRWTPPRRDTRLRFGGRRRSVNLQAWVAALGIILLQVLLRPLVLGAPEPGIPVLALEAVLGTIDLTLVLYAFILIIYILAGFIALPPGLTGAAAALVAPLLGPLRRLFPPRVNVDFTPLVVLLIIGALLIFLPAF